MTDPLLRVAGLSKQFGDGGLFRTSRPVRAVTDVDLTVGAGETVGLVGESGSGKSTIGRLVLGLLEPTAGTLTFDGAPVLEQAGRPPDPALRRRMQLVFQDPYSSLDPRRRVGAQIADGLDLHDIVPREQRDARVAKLLTQVGLDPQHASRFPHEFSGGQRQRIAIARALAPQPDFIVADEAISALDVSVQAQVMGLLSDLRTRLGLSILFISHDLAAVRHLCDRVVVLYLGRVMEEGPSSEVLSRPRHPYTASLLSAAPVLGRKRSAGRIRLKGDPPSPVSPPSGCVFHTRCPFSVPACSKAVPAWREGASQHRYACIRDDLDLRPSQVA
jgi:peptide/nickel transport system ATP-binding protein